MTTNLYPLSIALQFFFFVIRSAAISSNATSDVSINCGSTGTSAARGGSEWIGDVLPEYPSLLQVKGSSTISTVVGKLISAADPVPYKRARISQSQFVYALKVRPGQKILRLHFNPTSYRGFQGLNDLFTVKSGHLTLLSNFSPSLTADSLGVSFFAKEFSLNIPKYQFINIIFSPESSESFDTYAFVNGIEIFSISFSFPYFQGGYYGSVASAHNILHQEEVSQNSVLFVGASDEVYLKCFIPKPGGQEAELTRFANYNSRKMLVGVGFEYFIRAHFSELGLKIAGAGDIMFKVLINEMVADTNIRVVRRSDEDDIPWHSDYMVMVIGNTEEGKRDISISLQSYDDLIDAHELASPNPWPPARDPTTESFLVHPPIWMNAFFIIAITIFFGGIIFVSKLWKAWEASITEKKAKPKPKIETETETETETFEKKLRRKLSSRVEWSQETWKADNTEKEIKSKTSSTVHLEWEETWEEDIATEKKAKVVETKIRRKLFSMVEPLQRTQADITERKNKSKTSSRIQQKLWENWEAISSEEENKPKSSSRAERLCRRFSLDEIQVATNNFSDALLIGRGGYGNVYKGLIDEEQYPVAVKRLKSSSNQGESEFLTEIEMLSKLRHVNLVSLIGYSSEHNEMIIVYEYIPCGTLADHLYKLAMESNSCSPLTWKQRLDICIGAGRGIDYLHTGCGVIHRDVKASNILLDENLIAKVSDFGLAKHENRSTLQSHVSTLVKGTIGYLDPSYFNTGKLTRKSDTYGFGVVLLEVLCGRPAVDSRVAENERALTRWARDKINKGEVEQIISKSLRGEISPNSLKTFLGVAERCLNDEPEKRPTMSEVVLQLELAVEQQETKHVLVLNEVARVSDDNHHSDERVVDDPLFTETVNYVVADPLFIGTKENEGQKEIISHEGKLEVATDMLWHDKAYLKECILFCSVFPSDYEFTKDMLVWQWIAGSLINLSEDEIEEVYMQCFDTLLNLDYIVPSGYDHLVDEIKYKIGNKMTMSLQNQLLEPKFQNNLEGKQTDTVKVEHLSLAFMKIDLINFGILKQCCRLQTLFIHRCYSSKVNYLPPDIFLELKALKILNLSHTNIKELPSSVENLTEVRYLDISETPIKWLPESMRCCSHLQTLKLDGCLSLVGLPKCTSKLINLRHLVLDIARQLQSMPTGIGELSKLLTLRAFLVGEDEGARIGELKNMNGLRGSLRLLNLENVLTKEEAAEAHLCNKHDLKKIELQWSDLRDEKNPDEEEILNSLQPPVGIQELKILFYSGGVLSSWISDPSFSELVNITLYRCRYCEILPSLGELPSLKILYVIENNIAKEINGFFCRKGSNEHHVAFPKLEKLSFDTMSELQQWTGLKKGDFPRLDCLIIQYCPKLIGVSFVSHLSSLSHLLISYCSEISCLPEAGLPPTLESLMIKDCPKLKERCCNEQCQDWSKVARVPAFYIDNEKVSL